MDDDWSSDGLEALKLRLGKFAALLPLSSSIERVASRIAQAKMSAQLLQATPRYKCIHSLAHAVRSEHDTSQLEEEERVLVDDFSPTFVYPIFGQEETIFGFKNLEIQVRLLASTRLSVH